MEQDVMSRESVVRYARAKGEAGQRVIATAFVMGWCSANGSDMWSILAEAGVVPGEVR